MSETTWPKLGCGVGLRNEHYAYVTAEKPRMDWFEAVSENFMDSGGRPLRILEKVRENYPVVLHGTSLSIASCDPLNEQYLKRLKALVDRIDPAMVSDHLCWCGVDGQTLHDLLPLPLTEEALNLVVERVQQLQDFLGRRILLENVSTYVTYPDSAVPEWEFVAQLAKRSGCGVLLDINNIYVNAFNHKFNALTYLDHIPQESVGYFHLAGHTDKGSFLFDTHTGQIIDPVWNLYREALKRFGQRSTLIEWDEDVPAFPVLAAEAGRARTIYVQAPDKGRDSQGQEAGPIKEISEKSPPLIEVQRWMKTRVQPAELASGRTPDEIVLNPQGGIPGRERMGVYSDGYLARIHAALSEAFPAVLHVVGEKTFQNLAGFYSQKYPSQTYNLSLAGRHLPEFLKSSPLLEKLPFLADLAELEWQISTCFHAFDETAYDPSKLNAVAPQDFEKLRIEFQPSVGIFASAWPVLDIWKARNTPVSEIKIEMENRPQHILIARKDGQDVYCELLQPQAFFALESLMKGNTLGELIEDASNDDSVDADEFQSWLAGWMGRGLIRNCRLTQNIPSR